MKTIPLKLLLIFYFFFVININAHSKYFFYEVSTDSSKAYIFGSIHFGKPEWYPFDQYIEDAFNKSDVLATEIELNNLSQASFINRMFANDTIDLKYKLKPENYQKALNLISKVGLSESMIQRIRPWFIAFVLQSLEMQQGSINPKDGVDLYFTRRANEINKEIIGIEDIDFQMSLIEKFECCADEIIERLGKDKETEESSNKMLDAWLNGDDHIINKLMNEEIDASEQYKSILHEILFKRNETMANFITILLKEKKQYFVVIGAAHLVGKDSVIEYLKKNNRKLKIKRI